MRVELGLHKERNISRVLGWIIRVRVKSNLMD
jgi:hypothetical protein